MIALQHSTQNQPQHLRLEPQTEVLTRSSSANFVGFVPLKCAVLMFTIPAVNLPGSQQEIKGGNNGLPRALNSHQLQTYTLCLSHPRETSPFGAPGLVNVGFIHFGEAPLQFQLLRAYLVNSGQPIMKYCHFYSSASCKSHSHTLRTALLSQLHGGGHLTHPHTPSSTAPSDCTQAALAGSSAF